MDDLFWFCVILMVIIAFWGVVVAAVLGMMVVAAVCAILYAGAFVVGRVKWHYERKARDSNPEGGVSRPPR